jgi:hypothetical protein
MSYSPGQGQFSPRGNMWAMIKSLLSGLTGINAGAQRGAGALQEVKVTYDFAVDGGAQATITPKASVLIPAGAVIFGGFIQGITLPVGPTATIAIGLGSGAQVAALKAATAIATYAAGATVALIPVFTAASVVKAAVDSYVTFTIATANLTAGKVQVTLYYYMQGE